MHECLLRRRHASSPAACLLLSSFASLAGPRDAEQFESWRPRRCVLDTSGSSTHGGCRRRRRRSTVAAAASEGSVWSRLLGVGRGASLVSDSTAASGSWREHGGSEAWRRPGGGRATANGGEAAWPAREPRAEAVRRKTEAKHRGRRAKAGVSAAVAMPASRERRPARRRAETCACRRVGVGGASQPDGEMAVHLSSGEFVAVGRPTCLIVHSSPL